MATTSCVPAVIDALLSAAAAVTGDDQPLDGVLVIDGFGVTEEPGDFLMVGVDDPDRTDAAYSASAEQQWAHANHTARDERGTVTCAALSWNGDGDQKLARDRVYAVAAALEDILRADPTLGAVDGLLWTGFGQSMQLTQNQDGQGALALLVFDIAFRARI